MTKKLKCTICGSKNLMSYRFANQTNPQNAEIFACKQCGHLEWFIDEEAIKIQIEAEEQEAKYNKELAKFEIEKNKLQKQIEELDKIIFDENQTVKNVNAAKEKKFQLEEQLNGLYPPVPF